MPLARSPHRLTEAEYLKLERAAEFRSEFLGGEMFAMAGGSPRHSLIATNLARELGNLLRASPCVPYNADLRVKVEATGLFTYPDLSIVCGDLRLAAGTDDTVVNPAVIVEVLSDSTEAYDRGKNFEHYRQILSLKEYLLASQSEPRMELFSRQGDARWLLAEATGFEGRLELPSLGITLSLAEVYARVDFVSGPADSAPASVRTAPE